MAEIQFHDVDSILACFEDLARSERVRWPCLPNTVPLSLTKIASMPPSGNSLLGSSRILVASVRNGGFFEASTPASNGRLKGNFGEQRLAEAARTIGALSTGISLPKLRPRRA